MPTFLRPDDKPVVQFDPTLEVSPFALFRMLRDDRAPTLVDVRRQRRGKSLAGAIVGDAEEWEPESEGRHVLFDDDGSEAEPAARRLQAAGYENVRILFGGLELYAFSLDPEVVGSETYLIDLPEGSDAALTPGR